MNAKELRIGNWVMFVPDNDKRYNNRRPVKVCEIFFENGFTAVDRGGVLLSFRHESKDAEGIPLTPEVLEKCGFVYDLNLGEYGHRGLSFVYLRAADDYKVIWVTSADSDETLCSVKSLHQLQNLYFALTGEELPYNP